MKEKKEKKKLTVVLGDKHEYDGLPDVLTFADGIEVQTAEDFEERKTEMLSLYQEYMYGVTPEDGYTADYEIVEEGTALDGKATRTQVRITVQTDKGSHDYMLLVYLPNNEKTCGVFVGENFSGNTSILDDENILPSCSQSTENITYGSNPYPVETIIDADLASDPSATVDALQDAKKVWKDIYGMDVIDDFHYFDMELGHVYSSQSVGICLHQGGHAMTEEDWNNYLEYAEQVL